MTVKPSAQAILLDQNDFDILTIGDNSIVATNNLIFTKLSGTEWQPEYSGDFNGADNSDAMMRQTYGPSAGTIEIYSVNTNTQHTSTTVIGDVGLEWQIAGYGDFSGNANETDMMMRNSNTGALEIYDIANDTITGAYNAGPLSTSWSIAGFGDFTGVAGETDMLLRNSSNNFDNYIVEQISDNQLSSRGSFINSGNASPWAVVGFGDFSTVSNTDEMMLRNTNTGMFEVTSFTTGANGNVIGDSGISLGVIGLEWTVAGFGNLSGNANETDMLMHNSNTGMLDVFDISNNAITSVTSMGAVGSPWQSVGVTNLTNPVQQHTLVSPH